MDFKFTSKLKLKKKNNLAILLNENYTNKNKYYKTFEDLKKRFNIYFFIIQFKKNEKLNNNNIFYVSNYSKIRLIIKELNLNFN